MKKSKVKIILIFVIILIVGIVFCAGAYAEYILSAKDVTYTKPDGTTVTVKQALDELRARQTPNEITMAEAQSNSMLTKTVNSMVKDAYGNKIIVPAGFKIKVDSSTNNATTVDKGIVIIDSNENEFVWIPNGTIYTNAEKTESKTIELTRYEFDESGTPTPKGDAALVTWDVNVTLQELETSILGNTVAKDISKFKSSAIGNRGFYIGRYEGRTGAARSAGTDAITPVTTKASDYVYNFVTQPQAAELARNMYQSATTFTSDLMNSYAWDTATFFLQTFGNNPTYSRQNSLNTKVATKGTNNESTKDVQCNVYDMASNTVEWNTETSDFSNHPCAYRGGTYRNRASYTSERGYDSTSDSNVDLGFRPILYV